MRILFNHLGYSPGPIKDILLEAPEYTRWRELSIVSLPDQETIWTGKPQFAGTVEGWSCGPWWRIHGLTISEKGRYAVRWNNHQSSGQSEGFDVSPDALGQHIISDLLFYFKGQRCSGIWDTADHKIPRLNDHQTRDVHGGWYDASGDTSKYLSHLSYAQVMNPQQTPLAVWSLARCYLIHKKAQAPNFFLERIRDEALHGADFLMRMQDPEGFWYTTVFDTWSKDPQQRELCSYQTQQGHKTPDYQAAWRQGGGMAIAALALASQLGNSAEYSADQYQNAAETGFTHLLKHGDSYLHSQSENLIDITCALLAATELHGVGRAVDTSLDKRLSQMEKLWSKPGGRSWIALDEDASWSWFHASDAGLPQLTLARLAQLNPKFTARAGHLAQAILSAQLHLDKEQNNPFGYPPHWVCMPGKAPRMQWFYPHNNPSGYWWQGENARLASLACAAYESLPFLDAVQARAARQSAKHYQDWILGRNPFDVCMLQGHGRNNPQYELGYENAPGGVCNGITSAPDNENDIAFAPEPWASDGAHNWRWGEQWMPHAAWLILALSLAQS